MLAEIIHATAIALTFASAAGGNDACADGTAWVCDSTNNGASVTIEATRTESTTPRAPSRNTNNNGGGGSAPILAPPPPRDPNAYYPGGRTRDQWLADCAFDLACSAPITAPGGAPLPGAEQADQEPADPAPAPAAPDPTTATIDDVAQFAPAPPRVVGEPDGFGVVGMPTNFVVGATEHTVDGEIFDVPVTVRFTPVSFLFDYGDGATRETTTPGTSWQDLDVPQFTATDTSHSYSEPGEYEARATIRYVAEADAGGGWFAVPGILEIGTAATVIRVVDVDTALVEQTCDEDPGGPGC